MKNAICAILGVFLLAGCQSSGLTAPRVDPAQAFSGLAIEYPFPDELPDAWLSQIEPLKKLAPAQQIQAINDLINKAPANENVVFGHRSPRNLFYLGGVCHDYAWAKMTMLERVGVGRGDMRIAVVNNRTTVQGTDFAHAVLVVRSGAQYYVLDNMVAAVNHTLPFAFIGYEKTNDRF